MTLLEFQAKVDALREKCGMRQDVNWPFVYDADEMGEILINEEGRFFFADKSSNWVESHLTLDGISNLRYKNIESGPRSERDIYVNFANGDYLKLHNWKKNSAIYTSIVVLKTEDNGELIDMLKAKCECYDNVRGNTTYVNVKRTAK